MRHRDHVRRVLHQHADVAVVGVVVPRAVRDDDVGLPLANEPRDLLAVLQVRFEFAVVNVEHLARDAENLVGLLHLREPALRERPAGLAASGRCRRW